MEREFLERNDQNKEDLSELDKFVSEQKSLSKREFALTKD